MALAWLGLAWLGMAWLGLVWLGLTWLDNGLGGLCSKRRPCFNSFQSGYILLQLFIVNLICKDLLMTVFQLRCRNAASSMFLMDLRAT